MEKEFTARYLVRDIDLLGPLGYKPDLPILPRDSFLKIKERLQEKGTPSTHHIPGCEIECDYKKVSVKTTSRYPLYKETGKQVLSFMAKNKKSLVSLLNEFRLEIPDYLK